MKHPALAHLPKRERWHYLQRFNSGWCATVGLFLFMVVTFAVLVILPMVLVRTGLTAKLHGRGGDAIAALCAVVPAVAAGALSWEALRRVVINRTLSGPARCRCGYDRTGLPPSTACPECGSASA